MSAAGARGYAPRALAIPALIGLAFLILPLAALVARVEWSTFIADVTSEAARSALLLSLGSGLITTLLCIVIGVPLALTIARSGPRLAAVLRSVVTVPLVLPPMVGGVALLNLFGRAGWFGGLGLSFSTPAVVLAQTFVALPFLVLAVEGAVRTSGVEYERTAAALGAGRWTILRRIVLPVMKPMLFAVTVLTFLIGLGALTAPLVLGGPDFQT
ncbi:ABC transporter permease subunit, partial [Pseudomonas sp. BGM005]|nr:ABC transporter permease subunit [Pseudomonas sp. BG5]